MRAERQVEGEAGEPGGEPYDDLAPEIGVGQPAVAEDQRGSRAADEALELATEIAGNAPIAQRGNKHVIRTVLAERWKLDPELEQELLELRRSCFSSEDFREAVRAFADKRRPEWRNR